MGLTFTPITITSGSLVSSDDLNSNFLSVMNAPYVSGHWETGTSGVYLLQSNWELNIGGQDTLAQVIRPPSSIDRGMLFSVISGGALIDSLLIHTDGTVYALQGAMESNELDYLIYNGFSGSGTGTVSHGWPVSSSLKAVIAQPSGGSATGIGYDSLGSTTVKIYCSGSWVAMAIGA